MRYAPLFLAALSLLAVGPRGVRAAEAAPSANIALTNGQLRLYGTPYPSADAYKLLGAGAVPGPYSVLATNVDGTQFDLGSPAAGGDAGFLRLEAVPMDANRFLAGHLLNRLAYGPTPDELERVAAIGADAYIAEQLAPEGIAEDLPHNRTTATNGWQFVTATGTGSSSSLYVYLTSRGEGYLDDLRLVTGTVPAQGANLLRNGDFELPLTPADWQVASNHLGSTVTTAERKSGNSSLRLVASEAGESRSSAIVQEITPALSASRTYALSFWWKPAPGGGAAPTARLSGSGIAATVGTLRDGLEERRGLLRDLRAWHSLNAVYSKRQLLEVLLQFFDNHFVTQHSKSVDYFDGFYDGGDEEQRQATHWEYHELQRWRQALLNPQVTFHDLLRISAESPAMILYLDTVGSRGDGGNIANENYARELFELFTFGVDNGYDQHDIEELSRIWTGWTVRYVAPNDVNNVFASSSTVLRPGVTNNPPEFVDDYLGQWRWTFRSSRHNTAAKYLFFTHNDAGQRTGSKVYPARLGPKYAGKPYSLVLAGRTGTNGIVEGYQMLENLANQPFTQEFISVKLCRLLVHDEFRHGVYDYAAAELTPEAALVKSCMDAWDSAAPKGQLRPVLRTILDSELFRSRAAAQHKVKTPFEFGASAVRAFLSQATNSLPTAATDGYSLRPLTRRAGNMDLFNRAEPDGFPETGPAWISAGTLAERLRFVQALAMPDSYTQPEAEELGGNRIDPVALIRAKLPAADRKNSAAVAAYLVNLLFPTEGRANLAAYREITRSFLDTADNGTTASPFANLPETGSPSAYEVRLRGAVAMLLTLPRFHEQ
ncbi:MAG: DUF1800 family protein [Limisphaerales bacterium]